MSLANARFWAPWPFRLSTTEWTGLRARRGGAIAESFGSDCCVGNAGKSFPLEMLLDQRTSSIPHLAAFPLHGDAGGIADLDPCAGRAGSIGAIDLHW